MSEHYHTCRQCEMYFACCGPCFDMHTGTCETCAGYIRSAHLAMIAASLLIAIALAIAYFTRGS